MKRKLFALSILFFSIVQLPSFAVSKVINDEDKYNTIPVDQLVKSVTVNCTGAQLDLTHYTHTITVNGNGNQIVATPCENLVLVGSGNSVDIVDGARVIKIRQSQGAYEKASALHFYKLDSKAPGCIQINKVDSVDNAKH